MQGTAGIEILIAGQIGGYVPEIRDLAGIDRSDQPFLLRLRRERGVDQHHVICTGVCAQLRQHFLFGIEILMHNRMAGCSCELGHGPVQVGSVALPVQDPDFVGGCGRTGKDRRNRCSCLECLVHVHSPC